MLTELHGLFVHFLLTYRGAYRSLFVLNSQHLVLLEFFSNFLFSGNAGGRDAGVSQISSSDG